MLLNTARVPNDGPTGVPILPYDPANAPDDDTTIQILAPNWLDNSDFDYSKDGYVNNPTVGGDVSEECYNLYRQRFVMVTDLATTSGSPTVTSASNPFNAAYTYPMDFILLNGNGSGAGVTGTLTRVSDGTATLSVNAGATLTNAILWFGTALAETSANALKSSGHSTFAANEGTNTVIPRWDKTNGWMEMGATGSDTFDIATPLPLNFVRSGLTLWFRCIVALNTGGTPAPVRIFAGIWDATSSQKRFLESTNFDLAATVVGGTGATSYTYKVIADLDDGRTIESDAVTIANGPASLSASNYIRLTWTNASGILNFRIYRTKGGTTSRVFTIRNGARDYNDYGTNEETGISMPSASALRPQAYGVSQVFTPAGENIWESVLIPVYIPATYDTSATTGKQWLRFGIVGAAGSARMLLLDRILLSTSNGGWQRSARDQNKILNQNPTSSPTSSTQGGTGIVPTCFTLDTPVFVCDEDGRNVRIAPIGEIEPGDYVLTGTSKISRVVKATDSLSETVYSVLLTNGVGFRCSPSERFITSRADKTGTRIDELTLGDDILCWSAEGVEKAQIAAYGIGHVPEPVRTLSLKGLKTFVAGVNEEGKGAIAHNRKADPGI